VGAGRWKDVGGTADGPQRLFAAVRGHENCMGGRMPACPPESAVRDGLKNLNICLFAKQIVSLQGVPVNIGNRPDQPR
jgi:hypothetical protein